ncbi:MAG: HAD family hydrolase [Eubacterium sp.]|nr:HAD family hydrolase [Eubacterium sp.]
MRKPRYKAVIFDMDGTVLDTLEDLRIAINYAMEQTGHRHDYTAEETKLFFGSGIRVAIRRALMLEAGHQITQEVLAQEAENQITQNVQTREAGSPCHKDSCSEQEKILAKYTPYYEAHCRDHTIPYAGVNDLLHRLRAAGIFTAVVSNKPDPAVQILAEAQFPDGFAFAAGERTGIRRKPAPDLVLQVLRRFEIQPREALYVGDSEIDIQTAENCGMECAAVTWGFRSRTFLAQMHPSYMVDSCEELLAVIMGNDVT